MQITERARNLLRAALQGYGTSGMKRALWNREFQNGRWRCLDSTPDDCVYPYIERYAVDGSILDLGCGSGSTANELSPVYADYTGIDVSDVAVQQAIDKSRFTGRDRRARFITSEFFEFVPDRQYNVILFRDSIYYIPLRRVPAVFDRYAPYLRDGGVFIVRLWGCSKNRPIIDIIQKRFVSVETYRHHDPAALVLVFR